MDKQTNDQLVIEQFEWGTEGLAPQDHHPLENETPGDVFRLNALDKILWLRDMSAARTAEETRQSSELGQMRANMTGWLHTQGGNDNSSTMGQNDSVT